MIYTDGIKMVADELEELHSFANEIGLKSGWFMDRVKVPFYLMWHWPLEKAKKSGKCSNVSTEWMEEFLKNKKQDSNG